MQKVAVIIANGTEEIEVLTPVDILRRAGVDCDLVSVSGEHPTCSHAVTIKADKTVDQVDFNNYSAIVIPGGMPGAINIANNEKVVDGIRYLLDSGKIVASICASPAVVLGAHGFVKNKKVTCYPANDFIAVLKDSVYTAKDVEVDGNIITANGPKSAMEFSIAVCKVLGVEPKI